MFKTDIDLFSEEAYLKNDPVVSASIINRQQTKKVQVCRVVDYNDISLEAKEVASQSARSGDSQDTVTRLRNNIISCKILARRQRALAILVVAKKLLQVTFRHTFVWGGGRGVYGLDFGTSVTEVRYASSTSKI